MKLFKSLAGLAIVTSISVTAFAQTQVENYLMKEQTARLQAHTLAALIGADYTTLQLPDSKIKADLTPEIMKSSAMGLGIAGAGGGFASFILGLRNSNDLAMVMSLAASAGGSYASDKLFDKADQLQKQMDQDLITKMKTDRKINAQVSKALAPWIIILNLDANQAGRLKVAVKNDLITQTQNSGAVENSIQINVLKVALENNLIDGKNYDAVRNILEGYTTGELQAANLQRSESAILNDSIQIAEMNSERIKKFLKKGDMHFAAAVELSIIVEDLDQEIAHSKLILSKMGKK